MAIDPSQSTPSDVATVSSLQSTTEASAKAAMRAPIESSWGSARGNFVGNILAGIGQAHWLSGTGGRWVPIDEVLGAEDTTPDISHLSLAEKRELVKRLEAEGHIRNTVEEEPLDVAEVITDGD